MDANDKKNLLLEMAKNGEPRPAQRKKLGVSLSNYTCPSCSSYNEEFTNKIKLINPKWFINPSDVANAKKRLLLEMAKNGEPRPAHKEKLGMSLNNYTGPTGGSYDEEFTNKIKLISPKWFRSKK